MVSKAYAARVLVLGAACVLAIGAVPVSMGAQPTPAVIPTLPTIALPVGPHVIPSTSARHAQVDAAERASESIAALDPTYKGGEVEPAKACPALTPRSGRIDPATRAYAQRLTANADSAVYLFRRSVGSPNAMLLIQLHSVPDRVLMGVSIDAPSNAQEIAALAADFAAEPPPVPLSVATKDLTRALDALQPTLEAYGLAAKLCYLQGKTTVRCSNVQSQVYGAATDASSHYSTARHRIACLLAAGGVRVSPLRLWW